MFKKIKNYFTFKKRMRIEILETLATICVYLESDSRRNQNTHGVFMHGHFKALKELSYELRKERL